MKRVGAVIGWLTIIIWVAIDGTAAGAWWQKLPWQVPTITAAIFLGYGFLRAACEEHSVVEKERDELLEASPNNEKREDVRRLLGEAQEFGEYLDQNCSGFASDEATYDDIVRWVDKTRDLIKDAFGKQDAAYFTNNQGVPLDENKYSPAIGPSKNHYSYESTSFQVTPVGKAGSQSTHNEMRTWV